MSFDQVGRISVITFSPFYEFKKKFNSPYISREFPHTVSNSINVSISFKIFSNNFMKFFQDFPENSQFLQNLLKIYFTIFSIPSHHSHKID